MFAKLIFPGRGGGMSPLDECNSTGTSPKFDDCVSQGRIPEYGDCFSWGIQPNPGACDIGGKPL